MITYVRDKSIFNSQADVLVNPVNCVGTMGAGLAREFAKRFPSMFKAYKQDFLANRIRIGSVSIYECQVREDQKPEYIINFPTKNDYRNSSRLVWIEDGLDSLLTELNRLNVQSVALPALGCGLGGLEFSKVKKLIESRFNNSRLDVTVFEPQD